MNPEQWLARLTAAEEIRQLVARYAVYVDARDIDSLAALYVPDVRISSKLSGRDALRQLFDESLRAVGLTILNVGTHQIDFDDADPSSATGIVYCRAEIQDGGVDSDRWIVHAIQYHDTYKRVDGRWYFGANRKHLLVYGADIGESPLGLPPANWPENQTGIGSVPHSLDTWQKFWGIKPTPDS